MYAELGASCSSHCVLTANCHCVNPINFMPLKFNPLNTKRRLLYSPYRAVNTFHLGYKNQSVYAVSGTSRCLFSDKYKTHKYSVGRAYSC